MKSKLIIWACTMGVLFLSACSNTNPQDQAVTDTVKVETKEVATFNSNDLVGIADGVVKDIVASVAPLTEIDKVAIATPVDISTLEYSDWLGRELAEMFITSLHKRGISVYEYKLKGWLEVTSNGDYIYSRNWQKLASKAKVTRVLSGTLSRNEKGVMLYARLVNIKEYMVEGASEVFIPYEKLPKCYKDAPLTCNNPNVRSNDATVVNISNTQISNSNYNSNNNSRVKPYTPKVNTNKNRASGSKATNVNARNNKSTNRVGTNNYVSSKKGNGKVGVSYARVQTNGKLANPEKLDTNVNQNLNTSNTEFATVTSQKVVTTTKTSSEQVSCASCKSNFSTNTKVCHTKCFDPVAYGASTSGVGGSLLVRDSSEQSQYDRR